MEPIRKCIANNVMVNTSFLMPIRKLVFLYKDYIILFLYIDYIDYTNDTPVCSSVYTNLLNPWHGCMNWNGFFLFLCWFFILPNSLSPHTALSVTCARCLQWSSSPFDSGRAQRRQNWVMWNPRPAAPITLPPESGAQGLQWDSNIWVWLYPSASAVAAPNQQSG